MSELSFRSFRNALLGSESRVRLEDEIPEQRPIIKRVKIEGELLDGVDIRNDLITDLKNLITTYKDILGDKTVFEKVTLIDQPEDNLDSEFIYKTIVKTLRKIKEHRQIIIVTHNPNIAVLGDAELIVPLKSTNNKAMIISSGSIDNSDTVKLCCQILEGGESAFKQRQEIYGF